MLPTIDFRNFPQNKKYMRFYTNQKSKCQFFETSTASKFQIFQISNWGEFRIWGPNLLLGRTSFQANLVFRSLLQKRPLNETVRRVCYRPCAIIRRGGLSHDATYAAAPWRGMATRDMSRQMVSSKRLVLSSRLTYSYINDPLRVTPNIQNIQNK